MSDIIDKANDLVEQTDSLALRAVRSKLKPEVEATGYCLACGEDVEAPRRWCDADCRDMWEKDKRRTKL
jgi:RNA polymerase-binding transcription factor DksA